MRLNKKIFVISFVYVLLTLGFLSYEITTAKSSSELAISIVFVVIAFILGCILYIMTKNYIRNILMQLSEVVASIIDMRETELFSTLEDDMCSKLQSQIIKLSGMLKIQNSRLEKEKSEIKSLITDIAHQLKNPLSNLNIYVSFLNDEDIDEATRREYVLNIVSQLEKLNWLMESMIKMSRLESGIIQLKPAVISLKELILTAIKQVYMKAEGKGIEIEFNPASVDLKLSVDKKWTSEAISNILDNAVKYTAENGRIIISITIFEVFVRLDIEDNGMGFEEWEINHIFKRFYRGNNARNEDGIGIGLYLAREIISQQEGYIKVKSKPGKGSTFSVFLPIRKE